MQVAGEEFAEQLPRFLTRAHGTVNTEFDGDRFLRVTVNIKFPLFVRAEGKVRDVAQQAIVDCCGGNLFEAPNAVMGPQIVDDRTPRGQSIAVRDVGKDGFAVRRIVDAADVFLGDSGFTPVSLKHNQIGCVLNNEPAQLGAVIHPHLIRSPVEAGERPCFEREQTGGG